MNAESRTFYLDTSAIRTSARLSGIPRSVVKTSALTLIELLNGVRQDDQSFARRRSALRRVLEDPALEVIWALPDQRMTSCFAAFHSQYAFREGRIDPLRRILEALLVKDERGQFLEAEAALPIEHHLDFFEHFDTSFGDLFRAATDGVNRDMRKAYDDAKQNSSSVVPRSVREGSFREFCIWFRDQCAPLNQSATVGALARRAVGLTMPLPDDGLVSQFRESYDGSIERFVGAFSYEVMSMASDMSGPGRNDALDLAHLLYLENTMELVTNDHKLRDVTVAIGAKSWTTDEFEKLK